MTDDRVRAVACNFVEGTKIARKGARCFLLWRTGGDIQRAQVLVWSRGRRWVEKWEAICRLDKFRIVDVTDDPSVADLLRDRMHGLDPMEMIADIEVLKLQELARRAARKTT